MKRNLVKVCPNHNLLVYIDDPTKEISDIQNVEGVQRAFMVTGTPIFVDVDPRYDTGTVAKSIEQVLAADVPDVFYG